MTPIDPVSQTQLATLITYLYDKPCEMIRGLVRMIDDPAQSKADEDIPLDQ
jgi:hypothetical protein